MLQVCARAAQAPSPTPSECPVRRPLSTSFAGIATALAVTVPAALVGATPASAASPYERGPAPTRSGIEATSGPFAVTTTSVADSATAGFGAARITYPTSNSQGTYGVVAISPGYTASESTIAWLRPRIASQGFVVISFETNSRYDQPGARGDQLLAALDHVVNSSSSTLRARVDRTRQAVIGHSMGGGGTLEAAVDRPSLQATVGLTPWNTDKTWPEITTPSVEIGAEEDTVAPAASHAIPFYDSIRSTTPKAYVELEGARHSAPNSPNTVIASHTIAWLKRYVDDDERYRQFLCPGPSVSYAGPVNDYRTNAC